MRDINEKEYTFPGGMKDYFEMLVNERKSILAKHDLKLPPHEEKEIIKIRNLIKTYGKKEK